MQYITALCKLDIQQRSWEGLKGRPVEILSPIPSASAHNFQAMIYPV